MLSLSPVACLNSDAAGEGRGETVSVLLILLLANDPHQDSNGDAGESSVSPLMQPCHGGGSKWDAELHPHVTAGT